MSRSFTRLMLAFLSSLPLTAATCVDCKASAVAFSPDGKLVAGCGSGQTVRFWNVANGKEIGEMSKEADSVSGVTSIVFSRDGSMLAAGGTQDNRFLTTKNKITIWDIPTGKQKCAFLPGCDTFSMAFSPDGTILVSGNEDCTIKLWDTTHQPVRVLGKPKKIEYFMGMAKVSGTGPGHVGRVRSVALAPDGKLLASCAEDCTVRLWDVGSGAERRKIVATGVETLFTVGFDGTRIISAGGNNIKVWSADTGKLLNLLRGHTGSVTCVVLSNDGQLLASGSNDNSVKLWDMSTGKQLRTLTGSSDAIESIALASDKKTLASIGLDETLRLWDVSTGKLRWSKTLSAQ